MAQRGMVKDRTRACSWCCRSNWRSSRGLFLASSRETFCLSAPSEVAQSEQRFKWDFSLVGLYTVKLKTSKEGIQLLLDNEPLHLQEIKPKYLYSTGKNSCMMKIICIRPNSTWCIGVSSPWNWCGARSSNTSTGFFRFGAGWPSPWIKRGGYWCKWWRYWFTDTIQCIALAGEIFEITRAARQGSRKMSVRSILERGVGSSLSHPPFYTHLEAGHHKTQPSKEKFTFVSTITKVTGLWGRSL